MFRCFNVFYLYIFATYIYILLAVYLYFVLLSAACKRLNLPFVWP